MSETTGNTPEVQLNTLNQIQEHEGDADALLKSIMTLLKTGNATVEMKKRYLLRAIDESWVNTIEDTLPYLDVIIRNPSKYIVEEEEVIPIELVHKVSPKSLQHLAQHTNLINSIEGDEITPSKLLNVYHEETIQTYENKFVNTLINRLYMFVSRRYEIAKQQGMDEKSSSLTFTDAFSIGDTNCKISLNVEMTSPVGAGDSVEKNYTYTSDLWKRVEKLYNVVSAYEASDFVQQMGKSYIRPPVMRTNAILKNKNLRQCLILWQFIESYDNAGYSMLIQENLENVDETYLDEIYRNLAVQYYLFNKNIKNEFEEEKELASQLTDEVVKPKIVDELNPIENENFDEEPKRKIEMPEMAVYGVLTEEDQMMLDSVEIALAAAEYIREYDMDDSFNRMEIQEPKAEEMPVFHDELVHAEEPEEPEVPAEPELTEAEKRKLEEERIKREKAVHTANKHLHSRSRRRPKRVKVNSRKKSSKQEN